MKLNKFAAYLSVLAAVAFSSCSEGKYWDEPSNPDTVYAFPKPAATIALSGSESLSSYELPISRNNTGSEQTIDVTAKSSDPSVISAPSTVTFANGAAVANYVLSINSDKMEIGKSYTVTLTLPKATAGTDSIAVAAANQKFTFTLSKNWTWKSIGWVPYTEDFVSTFYGVENLTYYVPIQEAEGSNGVYRLVNPYGLYYPYNEPGDYKGNVTSYMEINAQDPQKVYLPLSTTTMDWGYGAFSMYSIAGLRLAQGNPAAAEGFYGTLSNGKITFPAKSLLVSMADYNDGGLYTANGAGAFCVDLGALTTSNPY